MAGFLDGNGSTARFNFPQGLATDAGGNVYVADTSNHRIRKVTPSGLVSTLAGSGVAGFLDGTGTIARFDLPTGVATSGLGDVYVADEQNHRIRKITPAGVVSTFAGNGIAAFADGLGTAASFHDPSGVATDTAGSVYVADELNHRIRKITPGGLVSTLAGSGTSGFADGVATAAQFDRPTGVAVDAAGKVLVADLLNQRVRQIGVAPAVPSVSLWGLAAIGLLVSLLARRFPQGGPEGDLS